MKNVLPFVDEITLVTLGPLTNVALALRLDAKIGAKLKDFVVMGGNIEGKWMLHWFINISF